MPTSMFESFPVVQRPDDNEQEAREANGYDFV